MVNIKHSDKLEEIKKAYREEIRQSELISRDLEKVYNMALYWIEKGKTKLTKREIDKFMQENPLIELSLSKDFSGSQKLLVFHRNKEINKTYSELTQFSEMNKTELENLSKGILREILFDKVAILKEELHHIDEIYKRHLEVEQHIRELRSFTNSLVENINPNDILTLRKDKCHYENSYFLKKRFNFL